MAEDSAVIDEHKINGTAIAEKDMMLAVTGLKTYFFTKKGVIPAVDDVSFTVKKGRIVGIVGESGCGKSMTALSLMGLVPAPSGKIVAGSIVLDGKNLVNLTEKEMCQVRGNEMSMIFQEPMTSLNPVYTVGKQVMEAAILHQQLGKAEAKEKALEMFKLVGIPEPQKRLDTYPHQLSGGLRQRVMIAMALCCRPKLLIADEPTTALDVTVQAQILQLMKKLQAELDSAIVLITHDMGVVAEVCDDVTIMYAGKIVEQANVFELFDNCLHPYTAGLLKALPTLRKNGERLYNIPGMLPNLLQLPKGCRFFPRCESASAICAEQEPDLVDVGQGHLVRCLKYRG
ncbi:Oligopeptide transport ATP-binding protein OppD [Sporomusa silvacetica DSM 10669]|uniref:Oligopeptide transport ATP-binding protein OppD n=2 Tax=Sporomusa silvacetica TaxID=55504 RepID=A0ABZ3IPY0_9FIRM|nr:ABC transporter ATP-binding protein [Sporomusa silvacetica]OZC13823.1 oligopeptide transport ATP-binding protein OppD [Sporomusa silvacetica DSM 10669]